MQDFSRPDVKKILLTLAEHLNVKGIRGLAEVLGEKESRLYAWIRNKNIAETGAILSKCPSINREWLRTGEGEIFRGMSAQGEQKTRKLRDVSSPVDVFFMICDADKRGEATEYQLRWKADYLRWEETRKKEGLLKEDPYCLHDPDHGQERPSEGEAKLMPLDPGEVVALQVYVTGGAGAPYEFIPSEPIEEIIIPVSFYTRSIVPVKVRGRSMEKTLRNGAIVGVDRSDRQIVNGELYAVWLPYQGTVIKRLYLDHKKIRLHSDNEEFRAQDVEVALDEVDDNFIQGRVKWAIQML